MEFKNTFILVQKPEIPAVFFLKHILHQVFENPSYSWILKKLTKIIILLFHSQQTF